MASIPIAQLRDAAPDTSGSSDGTMRLLSAQDAAQKQFRAEWASLVERASEANPFFEPWFLLPSLEGFDKHKDVSIAALYNREQLIGLVPLRRTKRYYRYPIPNIAGWRHDNMFCGSPLIAKGSEREFWRALLAFFDERPAAALFAHFTQMPASGPVTDALREVAAKQGRKAAIVHKAERAMLSSALSSQDYFNQSLSTKKRKELRRQQRRLGEEGELIFERQTGGDNIAHWCEEFLALEKAGWKGDQGSSLADSSATEALFSLALEGACEAGKLERLTLRLDGKPIAMLANFITAPGSYSFKTAFDEEYARFSPGVLLQRENLALLDNESIDWCDSCAAEGHPMIERIWREKRAMISVSLAIGGRLRRSLFAALLRGEAHSNLAENT
jgi:CelD/BcsL family acetyltransferase involved in cellulose biosynthesis